MPPFKRAYRGLFANRMIQFGNKVSFAENKTRRCWKPNVQIKSMYSETLGKMLRFRMTTHAMRCVKKAGGIEEYLLKAKESEIKYPRALKIKQDILAVRKARKLEVEGEQGGNHSAELANRLVKGQVGQEVQSTKVLSGRSALRGSHPSQMRHVGLLELLLP